MKHSLKIAVILILFIGFMSIINSCKKENDPTPAVLTTANVSGITLKDALSGGNVTSDGGASVTARGVCWNTATIPSTANNKTTDGTGTGSFESTISGLISGTKYYVRAYATNSAGTAYGNEIGFTTLNGTVTDIDGNLYNIIIIDTQTWMKENLKVTNYSNGTSIPNVNDNSQWQNLMTGAFCDYNNTSTNSTTYGKLYNWYAVMDSRNLCPAGWHIPSDVEWTTLIDNLGGEEIAGGKLKEIGTTHWLSPNTQATNQSSFTALPGGERSYEAAFIGIGVFGAWWSATQSNDTNAWYRTMHHNYGVVLRNNFNKNFGFSVRCVKDN